MSDSPTPDGATPRRHAPRGPLKVKGELDRLREENPLREPGWRGCTARSKRTGKQCNGIAIQGGHVCRMHGGSASQVKEAAMARLLKLQHPAIDRMAQLIDQTEFPTVSYAASRDVLDRTLGKPTESVAVDHSGELTLRHELS